MKSIHTDIVIVGTGCSGLFAALHAPKEKKILMLTKTTLEESDSFLAQGGICVLKDSDDYESFFKDTIKAGHYENRRQSVEIMIKSSPEIIAELEAYGVRFAKDKDGNPIYTKEGCHSKPRILFHEDITGKEITSKLLAQVKQLDNVDIYEYTTMTDIIEKDGRCRGILAEGPKGEKIRIHADHTIFASGGIGGRYRHSTNFPHLTGDAIEI